GESPQAEEYTERLPGDTQAIAAAFAGPASPVRADPPAVAGADLGRDLLLGLLAVQTGLIPSSALRAAFAAPAVYRSRPVAATLLAQGALDSARRTLLEGLVAEHVRLHGGHVGASLAALPAGRSTREALEQLGDAGLNATLSYVGSDFDPNELDAG